MTDTVLEGNVKTGRKLRRTETKLANSIKLVAVPLDKVRGRHYMALRRIPGSVDFEVIADFQGWQKTEYVRQPEDVKFGAGGWTYRTRQIRVSWILDKNKLDHERTYQQWKSQLKALPTTV